MSKLWEKSNYSQLNNAIEKFEVGEDYILDTRLVEYDIYGSLAHSKMLEKIGILTPSEFDKIAIELKNILVESKNGNFSLSISDEDVHSKIENILTQRLGDIGKKIHTARSRNDQVLLDIRLFTRQEILGTTNHTLMLCQSLLDIAMKYEFIPMPGYTHMQIAMPSSVGMWCGSFVESFLDEYSFLINMYDLNDQCPLGSGAGYGVSLPIDREMTKDLLGFKRLQLNAMYCGNSRGKIESNIISSLVSVGIVLNKMATDLLLFTTKEFDFFEVSDEITTGSSIMPQKKNLDLLELIRAKVSSLIGLEVSIKTLITNLPSGYNRDFQDTKKFLISAFDTINPCLILMKLVVEKLKPKEERLISAHKKEIYATDAAYQLVEKGMPFRDAYRHIGTHLEELNNFDPHKTIQNRKSLGTTGNLNLISYKENIEKAFKKIESQQNHIDQCYRKLLNE